MHFKKGRKGEKEGRQAGGREEGKKGKRKGERKERRERGRKNEEAHSLKIYTGLHVLWSF